MPLFLGLCLYHVFFICLLFSNLPLFISVCMKHQNKVYSYASTFTLSILLDYLPLITMPVLLGAAILGAVAARKYFSMHDAMKALNASGQVIHPSKDPKVKKYHDAKYRIFVTFMTSSYLIVR
ncbi:hypothetical protein RchiOBHm_Chr4g0405021 [Rosa chinensis]|uniref:Uncharacterized protein n=1 Tax=Rosa chinensis TaxID=74649 RepID=A0A2P6QTZ0_ROSCH|nr:hypothetical protein RchiOBHm_Chr4g0405021 [Rosa chinensis]